MLMNRIDEKWYLGVLYTEILRKHLSKSGVMGLLFEKSGQGDVENVLTSAESTVSIAKVVFVHADFAQKSFLGSSH